MLSWLPDYAKTLGVRMEAITPSLSDNGNYVWPIEEFIARKKCGPRVAARLRKLNPNGVEEGSYPRGYHPHKRAGGNLPFPHVSRGEIIRNEGRAWLEGCKTKMKASGCGKRVCYSLWSVWP